MMPLDKINLELMAFIMNRKNKKNCFFMLLVTSFSLFVSSCDLRQFDKDVYIYSDLSGIETVFDLGDMYYQQGDTLGVIKDCSSEEFPDCIILGSTVIMLPKRKIFEDLKNDFFEDYYEGKNEQLNLEYSIMQSDINVLGVVRKGFLIKVGDPFEMTTGFEKLGSLKGDYFYELEGGILFSVDYYEVLFPYDQKVRKSNLLWSTAKCGFFASKKCLK